MRKRVALILGLLLLVAGFEFGTTALFDQPVATTATATASGPSAADVDLESLLAPSAEALRCTASECETCNKNGLQCVPENGQCYCDPWPAE